MIDDTLRVFDKLSYPDLVYLITFYSMLTRNDRSREIVMLLSIMHNESLGLEVDGFKGLNNTTNAHQQPHNEEKKKKVRVKCLRLLLENNINDGVQEER